MGAAENANKTQAMAVFIAANPPRFVRQVGFRSVTRQQQGIFIFELEQPAKGYTNPPNETGPNVGVFVQSNSIIGNVAASVVDPVTGNIAVAFSTTAGAPVDPGDMQYIEVSRFPTGGEP